MPVTDHSGWSKSANLLHKATRLLLLTLPRKGCFTYVLAFGKVFKTMCFSGRLADRIPSSRQAITMNGPSSDPIHGHYITQAAAVLNIAR